MAADIIEVLGLASNCAVPIVASVTTVDSLHADLVPGRGKNKGFDAIVSLKLPSAVSCSILARTGQFELITHCYRNNNGVV